MRSWASPLPGCATPSFGLRPLRGKSAEQTGTPRTERPALASDGQRQGAARHALSPKAELCWAANPSRHFGGEGRGEGEGSPKQRRPPLPLPPPPPSTNEPRP